MSVTKDEITLAKAIAHYGKQKQVIKAIEEMSELQKELCKDLIGCGSRANITEELADCYITMKQIMMIYGISLNDVDKQVGRKIKRLEERLNRGTPW